jgi:hypothetical protein
MARIRSLKPSFWSSQKIGKLSRDARLLAIGLISCADDQGRFLASPNALMGHVYPNDTVTVRQVCTWREELATVGLIELYAIDGFEYGRFPRWATHQKIAHPYPSTFPEPIVNETGTGTE